MISLYLPNSWPYPITHVGFLCYVFLFILVEIIFPLNGWLSHTEIEDKLYLVKQISPTDMTVEMDLDAIRDLFINWEWFYAISMCGQVDAALEQGVDAVRNLVLYGFNRYMTRFNLEQKYKYHKVWLPVPKGLPKSHKQQFISYVCSTNCRFLLFCTIFHPFC